MKSTRRSILESLRKSTRLRSRCKHSLHCITMLATIGYFIREYTRRDEGIISDPFEAYGKFLTIVLYFSRFISLVQVPYCLFNFLGFFIYNAFNDKVILEHTLSKVPFLCFRIVTKGCFPKLVRENIQKNLQVCCTVGLEKFLIEIVTEKPIDLLSKHSKIRQTIVPSDYRTKNGSLFKVSRAGKS